MSGLAQSVAHIKDKLRDTRLHDAKVNLINKKHQLGKFSNLVNPGHRHDEAHEKACDEKRAQICESHRFRSFFPERHGNTVKWYVDGRDYFWAVSVAMERARETIYIADWWLSPELYLRRPPHRHEDWRLDRLLKRRAEAGVKIYVIVYREVEAALTCNSQHTKHALEALCPDEGSPGYGNIRVMRHPDHNVLENAADMTQYWAHHEKFIVIDHKLAFVGGVDLCFGRFDTDTHQLSDAHPAGPRGEVWPGQDFNNNRVLDFQTVDNWSKNDLDKSEHGRMPWHDVAVGLIGPSVYDVAEHFVLRWNFVKRDKYKRDRRYDWLVLRGREGDDEDLIGVQRPSHPIGDYVVHPASSNLGGADRSRGTVNCQVVRSSSDWSSGILKDHSIQNAYVEVIGRAQHLVYIENQFFITATGSAQAPVHNKIGRAIVDAVVRADRDGRRFRVVVVIPCIPGFAGDLREDAATGTRAIMDYQYKSICRGEHSIFEQVKRANVDPRKYIFFFNLRSYDRLPPIKTPPSPAEGEQRPRTQPAHTVAQHAMAGSGSIKDEAWEDGGDPSGEVGRWIQEELYVHGKVLIVDDRIAVCGSSNINDRSQLGDHDSELAVVMEDSRKVRSVMDGKPFEAGRLPATLRRHLWREHLGLLPASGPDAEGVPSAMPPGEAGGPEENEEEENEEEENKEEEGRAKEKRGEWGCVVDPLGDEVWELWTERATTNTTVYRHIFHADPDDNVKTFHDYDRFLPPRGVKSGHVFDQFIPAEDAREKLAQIKGHLVWMPLEFLEEAEMAEKGLQVNQFTESIYT